MANRMNAIHRAGEQKAPQPKPERREYGDLEKNAFKAGVNAGKKKNKYKVVLI